MARDVLDLLRRENPAPEVSTGLAADALLARIVAQPRVAPAARPSRVRKPATRIAIALAVFALGTGVAFGGGLISADDLFQQNPEQNDPAVSYVPANAVPGTARMVTAAEVPGIGRVQIWTARGVNGAVCLAARLPDTSWAATPGSRADGAVPGCTPRRAATGVLISTGFDYREADFFKQVDGRPTGYRLWYGVIEDQVPATATSVTDTISGETAAVVDGRYYAFVVRDQTGDAATIALVAHAADGSVVADEEAAAKAADPG
ncbi:MAG TPA: hypothetical protein VGF46_05060 [Gaiellales bacterium]